MSDGGPSQFHRFPTTHWSLVGRAGDEGTPDRREALDQLLRDYWPALKTHLLIRQRMQPHEADDLVQGFITSKMLDHNLVQLADCDRGRFRTLLATALDNYVRNEARRRQANKREADRAGQMPEQPVASRDSRDDPNSAFDQEWARQVLLQTVEQLEQECRSSGRDELWDVFQARTLLPLFEGQPPVDYGTLIARHGFRSPSQASNALITAKRMFARLLRAAVQRYVRDESEIDDELRQLEAVLARTR